MPECVCVADSVAERQCATQYTKAAEQKKLAGTSPAEGSSRAVRPTRGPTNAATTSEPEKAAKNQVLGDSQLVGDAVGKDGRQIEA